MRAGEATGEQVGSPGERTSVDAWHLESRSRRSTLDSTGLLGFRLGQRIRRKVPTGGMFLATSHPGEEDNAPSFDLPLSKVDFIKVSLCSDLLIVLNLKVFVCHGVLGCCGGLCVWERCSLQRTCPCRVGRRTRATGGGLLLPLSLSIVRSRGQSVRVGFDATQLGPWYPLIQPLIRAFVVDIGMAVRTTMLENVDKLCREQTMGRGTNVR